MAIELVKEKILTKLKDQRNVYSISGFCNLAACVILLMPRAFFLGNMLHAILIVMIMGLALRSENQRRAMIEIPFLIMPLVMIWLKYPFKFK